MVVQHNLRAMNANRMLGITTGTLSKSSEKLSSGYKINRAADDAAGLAISEKMRKQMRGLTQASSNAEDGISAVQTAEGALTEVHDMLQRMNELAVKAANGTNALSDRQTIQDEVEQLLTEIDRVAETTKFNEIYLLKGDANRVEKYLEAKDAGIDGQIQDGATFATFTMNALQFGDSITIAGKQYSIGEVGTAGAKNVQDMITASVTAGELVTIDGVQYTVASDATTENADKNILTKENIAAKVVEQSSVLYKGRTYHVMKDEQNVNGTAGNDGVDDVDASVITAAKAYSMIRQELTIANSIGAKTGGNAVVADVDDKTVDGKAIFAITQKGKYDVQEALNFQLHVGADADMTNKIGVTIDALDTRGLGINGLNVKDSTGAYATYAIDSIAEAIAHVSKQRSLLGAVQNRLEHTINNLDNVVENTTAAESQIRDTDMATEMVKYSNANILQQAGQSMLAQSNQANQGVLSLLQ
ncbi:MAG: flagellar hook protein [Lachnospiraceae bacterium]|nr:flagellar hook protein [Lachnospiraceae bacterium]MDE7203509.1 flagellar hook protein [Lachnospiraceae bacterium]